jgi:transcriptional regulator with XRE-family HTH domain
MPVHGKPRERTYEAFGAYVRSQRQLARLSLRQAAALARISNPYLSQIEHGLALPSVTVIRGLADALHVSAETLLHLATGISGAEQGTDAAGTPGAPPAVTEQAILADPRLDDAQRHALLAVLASFVGTSPTAGPRAGSADDPTGDPADEGRPAPTAIHAPRRRQQPAAPPKEKEVQDHA